jgi:hypothetical protein
MWTPLYGDVVYWGCPTLDVDALVTPLGLSGVYTVFGIDTMHSR